MVLLKKYIYWEIKKGSMTNKISKYIKYMFKYTNFYLHVHVCIDCMTTWCCEMVK